MRGAVGGSVRRPKAKPRVVATPCTLATYATSRKRDRGQIAYALPRGLSVGAIYVYGYVTGRSLGPA